jgi:hypothetical protein
MKTPLATLACLAVLPLAAAAQATKEDIKKLVAAGVSDDVVLTYVRANGPAPKLSADEIIELKQAGAGDKVLGALAGQTTAPAPAPAPARTEVVERVVERPTYVYSTPSVSSYWCSSHYCYDTCHTYVRPIVTYSSPYYYGYGYGGYYRRPYYSYYSGYCGPSYYRPSVGVGYSWGGHHGSRWGVGVRWGW